MADLLARSLVDAAAEAIGAAVHMPGSRSQAEQAVAAVLETLAAEFDGVSPEECHPTDTLLRLVEEVRQSGEG